MTRALNAFLCKYGPYVIIGVLLILVGVVQLHEFQNADALEQSIDLQLPRAVVDLSRANRNNHYQSKAITSSSTSASDVSMVFIVRTYSKHVEEKSMPRLLNSLENQQCQDGDCNLDLSVILLPTDKDSREILNDEQSKLLASGAYKKIELETHKVPDEVYIDNCCQIDQMCNDAKFAEKWKQHAYRKYGRYKDVPKKMDYICAGNNMLHYVLTDIALRYTIDSCKLDCDSKFIVMTNGDNEYKEKFASKVSRQMKEDPSTDLIMTDYLERGVQYVQPTIRINQMDLGCMVWRVSSLQRLFPSGSIILASLPFPNTWPDHYYGADGEFVMHITSGASGGMRAKVKYQRGEALYTHW